MQTEHWSGYAKVERPTCCRWCPLLAVPNDERKTASDGECMATWCTVRDIDGIDPDCPGAVVVQVS